jgi:hypothetical protein
VGSDGTLEQSLVGCDAGEIVPVQLTVVVWPVLDGTVIVCDGGVEAELVLTASKKPARRPAPIRSVL